MYHVELRQFPHNFCQFNLTEEDLSEKILDSWARGDWVEVGERKWSPHHANLTVLEGPRLPVEQLSMGRGWRNAVRQGQDVTGRVLEETRARLGDRDGLSAQGFAGLHREEMPEGSLAGRWDIAHGSVSEVDPSAGLRLAADSLGLELLSRLGQEPAPIAMAWQIAGERYPEHCPSDCLRLAEHAIRSLVASSLIVVLAPSDTGQEPEPCESGEQLDRVLGAVTSWTSSVGSHAVLLSRT